MLATVAALVIVLGLMVSLARYVRRQASDQLTKQVLAQLDLLIQRYQSRYRALPVVPPFVEGSVAVAASVAGSAPAALPPSLLAPADDTLPDEATLHEHADLNNRAVVQALRIEARRFPAEYADMPQSFFADGRLLDAWGTPIVFMPSLHAAVGMAMENRPFFLSAGPDGRFRTLEDNLYSYEEELGPSATAGVDQAASP
jgi:type II secretory pathway pseudopilin PulG